MIRPMFHLCVVTINLFTIVYDQAYIVLPFPTKAMESLPFQGRSMFLTMWCLMLQTIYFLIAILNDVCGTNARAPKNAPVIRKVKDTVFSLAFPVAIYVSLTFWIIYLVDKQLILPEHIERLFPKWLNHVMHTTVAVFIIMEMLITYRNYPFRNTGTTIMITFMCSYIFWLFVIFRRTGVWVYPFLDHLNWLTRGLFIAASVSIGLFFYLMGEKLDRVICAAPIDNFTNGKIKSGL